MKFSTAFPITALALSHLTGAAPLARGTSGNSSNVVLANQLGPYPVTIYEHEVKTSTPDPFAPDGVLRRLLVTVYRPFLNSFTCPLEDQTLIPWAPPAVAAAIVDELLYIQSSSANSSAGNSSADNLLPGDILSLLNMVKVVNCSRPFLSSSTSGPLVIFQPGLGGNHNAYQSSLQAVASSGYTVVAIDPTYEASAVEFPDGDVAYANASALTGTISNSDILTTVRAADVVHVLDAIERGEVPSLPEYCNSTSSSAPKSLRAVTYGHSEGGSSAMNAAVLDSRILGVVNLDGHIFGALANRTISKPVLFLASGAPVDFDAFFKNQALGWKTLALIDNIVHYSFTDLPQLADLLGIRSAAIDESLTGTINSHRLSEIMWRYSTDFLDYVFNHVTPELLDGPVATFPDVQLKAHSEGKASH